jgi:hypothetical protein
LFDPIRAVNSQYPQNGEVKNEDDPVKSIEPIERTDVAPGFIYEVVKVPLE